MPHNIDKMDHSKLFNLVKGSSIRGHHKREWVLGINGIKCPMIQSQHQVLINQKFGGDT